MGRVLGGEIYVSFSGGKDSTVLKHIVDNCPGICNVPAVFINTGLEYPEIQKFVHDMKSGKYEGFNTDIEIIRPEMRFDEVIKKYGYPIISKQVSDTVEDAKRNIPLGKETVRVKMLTGNNPYKREDGKKSMFDYSKWAFLIDAPFKISNKCCSVMKKRPVSKYEKRTGRKPIIGILANESAARRNAWIKNGCNVFSGDKPKSQPMAFWTEQDILEYIVKYNLPYAKVYGEIKQDSNGNYYTTGADRTGCMFCMFGCHLEKEPNRFQKMKVTHPVQYAYCMRPVEENGLGLKTVLDYINIPY